MHAGTHSGGSTWGFLIGACVNISRLTDRYYFNSIPPPPMMSVKLKIVFYEKDSYFPVWTPQGRKKQT